MTIKRFIEKAINGGWTGLCMDDDTRGGWCSKCGAWKGGAYGMNGAGVQSKHVCHQPETKDGSMTLLQSQQEKARAGIKQNFAEQMAPSGVFAVQANMEDIYLVLDSIISSTVTAVLDGVREVMPKEVDDKEARFSNDPDGLLAEGYGIGFNSYRTALLKGLEEMEGNI